MFDLALDGRAARLTLNRPEARNAIPVGGWGGLAEAAQRALAEGARLLALAGSRPAFCAGADVSDFAEMRSDEAARTAFRVAMREGIEAIAGLPIPTVAAIEGPCFGAGVALAMACDLRLAGPAASFAITPAKFGIGYPQEDVHRLVSLVGPGQASRLLLSAGTIDAVEALRIGLVERVEEDLDAELASLTQAILAGDSDSHAALKRAIRLAAQGVRSDSGQDRRFDALLGSDALAARLAAMRRKG